MGRRSQRHDRKLVKQLFLKPRKMRRNPSLKRMKILMLQKCLVRLSWRKILQIVIVPMKKHR
eukprot:2500569-Amphidinium_carterae.1